MAHGRKRAKRTRIPITRVRLGNDGSYEFCCELCGDWTTSPRWIPPVTHAETDMVLYPAIYICQTCHDKRSHTLRPARRVARHEYPVTRALNMVASQGSARPGTALSGSGHNTGSGPNGDHIPRNR